MKIGEEAAIMGSSLSSQSQQPSKFHGLIFVDGVFQGRGKIRITDDEIIVTNGREKQVFEIRHLRRYGQTLENQFFFEGGRSSKAGSKEFIISTDKAEILHQQVARVKEGIRMGDEETRRKSASAHQLIASCGTLPGFSPPGLPIISHKNHKTDSAPFEEGKKYSTVEIYSAVSGSKSCSEGALHQIPKHDTLFPYVNIDRERTAALKATLNSIKRP